MFSSIEASENSDFLLTFRYNISQLRGYWNCCHSDWNIWFSLTSELKQLSIIQKVF